MARKIIKSDNEKWWYGVPGIRMIWHGEWNDPELECDGYVANYYDVENTMHEYAKEDGVDADNDDVFAQYVRDHADDAKYLVTECGTKEEDNDDFIDSGCHEKTKKKKTDKSVKSEWVVRRPDRTNLSGYGHRKFNTEEEARKFAEGKDNCEVYEQRDYNTPRLENYGWKKTVKSSMPGRERGIQAIMDEYGCTREEAIEIMNEEIQNSRKPVKSSYNPWNGEGSIRVSLEIVEDGEHSSPDFSSTVMDLDDFIAECKSYAESCNGSYFVNENDSNSYKIEFMTGDDSMSDNPGTDPYYEESCGIVIAELIYPYTNDMAVYIQG